MNQNSGTEFDDDLPPPPPEDEEEDTDLIDINRNPNEHFDVHLPFNHNDANEGNTFDEQSLAPSQHHLGNESSPFDDINSPFDDPNNSYQSNNQFNDSHNSIPPKRPPPSVPPKKSRIHFSSLFVPYQPSDSDETKTDEPTSQTIVNTQSNHSDVQNPSSSTTNPNAKTDSVILNTVKQLIQNETDHQQNIECALKFYYVPFKSFISKSKKSSFSDFDLNMIMMFFSNLEVIHNFHFQFLSRLNHCAEGNEPLGIVMKSTAPMFKVYTDYLIHVSGILDTVKKLRKNKEFSKFLDECKSKSGNSREFEEFIALPIDDLNRYERYINSIINRILVEHPDYNNLKDAISSLNKVNEHIIESKLSHENRIKIISIQSKVVGIPNGLILVAPHRKFLKDGNLQMKHSASKKGKIHNVFAYAMNDMILITKEKGLMSKQEICKHIISYHDANITQLTGDRYGLLIETTNNNSYSFYFHDENVMNEWIDVLKSAFKTLKNSRATSLVESSDTDLETKLQVEILSARDVVPLIYDPPDLYVNLSIGGQTKRTRTNAKCRFNPTWDETHVFNVKNPYSDVLLVEIKDARGEKVVTSMNVNINEMYDYVERKCWFKLNEIQSSLEIKNPSIFMGITIGPAFKN